jgi:hypothetical protein
MRKIIINEKIESKILQYLINEEVNLSDKVLLVKKYLDDNFARADNSTIGLDGFPRTEKVVAWLDDYKQLIKNITDVQLFYVIQEKFKNIISDKKERDNFLKQVIKDWYNHRITKNGSLSV